MESFDWDTSSVKNMRDVNEKRHGAGMKCVRFKSGKIVAVNISLGFVNLWADKIGKMDFQMEDEFECMPIMSRFCGW